MQDVFFDATGTLIRVRGSVGELYATAASRHGVEVSGDHLEATFQALLPQVPQDVRPGLSEPEVQARERAWWKAVTRRTFAGARQFDDFDAFFDDLFDHFRRVDAWELLPHAADTLEKLTAAGLRLGIISDMDSRLFDVLRGFGIAARFASVNLSFPIGYSKPDRRLFQRALERAGARAVNAVHVGDSLAKDVHGALGAGMGAVWLSERPDSALPKGVPRIAGLDELPELLATSRH